MTESMASTKIIHATFVVQNGLRSPSQMTAGASIEPAMRAIATVGQAMADQPSVYTVDQLILLGFSS